MRRCDLLVDLSGHVAVDLRMSRMDGVMSEMEAAGGGALVMAGHRGVEDCNGDVDRLNRRGRCRLAL